MSPCRAPFFKTILVVTFLLLLVYKHLTRTTTVTLPTAAGSTWTLFQYFDLDGGAEEVAIPK
jgi:hypothetical protein